MSCLILRIVILFHTIVSAKQSCVCGVMDVGFRFPATCIKFGLAKVFFSGYLNLLWQKPLSLLSRLWPLCLLGSQDSSMCQIQGVFFSRRGSWLSLIHLCILMQYRCAASQFIVCAEQDDWQQSSLCAESSNSFHPCIGKIQPGWCAKDSQWETARQFEKQMWGTAGRIQISNTSCKQSSFIREMPD